MKLTVKTKQELENLNINIEKAQNMTRNDFIKEFKDKSDKMAFICSKLDQYDNCKPVNVKRNKTIDLYKDGNITTNKKKYNKAVYDVLCVILSIFNKYDTNIYGLPIEYINKCANTSNMTAKKVINALINYDIIEFVGYTREHSFYAESQFKLKNKKELEKLVKVGSELYEKEYNDEEMKVILSTNSKAIQRNSNSKKLIKALKIMKSCPDAIRVFNEGNIYDGYFKQKFLLDGCLRAYSNFTLTKNPAHIKENEIDVRSKMLSELNDNYEEIDLDASIYTLSRYLKYDIDNIENNSYFYSIFDSRVKKLYNNESPLNKKIVKPLCMSIYMHGYSYTFKAIQSFNDRYKSLDINETLNYFTGKNKTKYTYDEYLYFFNSIYEIMLDMCIIERSNIFIYESMLFSLIIKLAADDGYIVVNAYDGFYIPINKISKEDFKKKYINKAYIMIKSIYNQNKEKTNKQKSKQLFNYLKSIGKLVNIDGRYYVEMLDGYRYIDFYTYNIIERKITNNEKTS